MPEKVIVITGANGGLGQAIARGFLAGSSDTLVYLGVRQRREQADALIAQFPARAKIVTLEVTSPDSWREAIATILTAHGRIDVLVNNAGHHEDSLLGTMSAAAWSNVIDSNLNSVFHGCQSVLPTMISQRFGRIINIASLSALLAPAGQTNYSAAKAGVVALTQSLAKEVARIGITVNAICPGYIATDALSSLPDEEKKAITGRIPMRRLGQSDEVAAAVRFLACAEAGYITGSVLKVDGGIL